MDADSLIHIARPEDGAQRLYPISMGRYGPTVAIPRILDTYRRLGLKQSFFIPGWCMEQYPQAVEAILKEGHEIGLHGWIHEDPMTTQGARQAEAFSASLRTYTRHVGQAPAGYRAPVYNITQQVVDLCIENGLLYDSSMMADDVPYLLKTEHGQLVELPVHWGTDDWPPFAHYDEIGYLMPVRGPSAGLAGFWEEFDAQYEAGGFFMLILHPFLSGRLARWRQVEAWIEATLASKNVWFATARDIAQHVKTNAAGPAGSVRVEHLPYYTEPQR